MLSAPPVIKQFAVRPDHPMKIDTLTTLHGLFTSQWCQTPYATAVACGASTLNYRELEMQARSVARRLRELGIWRGSLVGLCVDRSLDIAVGVLGITMADAAYVPLDPAYPKDRLEYMLADAQIGVLLTHRSLVTQLPQSHAVIVCLDELGKPSSDGETWDIEARGDDLAYVMYTSGSTGQPKGVMIEHGSVVNTINDINERFRIGPYDRVLALSSYGFDLSVYDMFGLWAVGGCVVIPEQFGTHQPTYWAQLIRSHGVTIWNSVPASLEILLDHATVPYNDVLRSLRLIMLSGDWIPVRLPDRIRSMNPKAQIVSLGGATEASIWSAIYPIGQCDPQWRSIPYGRAMVNQTMHVLDEQMRDCQSGEVGQIYLGGIGLARGYLRRPELTSQRFIENPLKDRSSPRLYATGDLGRLFPDGTVEFLGRIDGQVKIRGYRVELGEGETALCKHPGIAQAAVMATDERGRKQLLAYCVARKEHTPTPADLRRFLRQSLPEYMIPTQLFLLDQLPLSENQKIDRHALAALDHKQFRAMSVPAAATNDVERRLIEHWKICFQIHTVGINDDFFELGGDSLLAAGLFACIEKDFGQAMSLDVLLESPTIRLLAGLLHEPERASHGSSPVTIQAGDARPPLFCLPGIGGNVLEFHRLAQQLRPHQRVYGIRPVGLEYGRSPHESIPDMAAYAGRLRHNR